ncbi:MAG: hypothetical protein MUP02_10255 [Actinobacteria bacterium]|nr:hypothetical protein [Actinomycetota bacterium]
MARKANNKTKNKFSIESLVLGILSVVFGLTFFLLIPDKPFGTSILQIMDAREDFTRYVFFLFLIMLMGVAAIGASAVSIVYGIKDYIGSYRGLYISKGKGIYLIGAILGAVTIILLIVFIIMLNIL